VTTIGLYKTECIQADSPFRAGPGRTLADLEKITRSWMHRYNTTQLMHRLGRDSILADRARQHSPARLSQPVPFITS
jgi:putative transposase